MAIDFLRNTGTEPLREAIGGPIVSRGGYVRPSVKYADNLKKKKDPLTEFSRFAHGFYRIATGLCPSFQNQIKALRVLPCGMCMIPTVNPATMSCRKFFLML